MARAKFQIIDARNKEVLRHLGLVRKLAWKAHKTNFHIVMFDDLYSAGICGLISAVERYKPKSSLSFSTYAHLRIWGYIQDEVKRCKGIARPIVQKRSLIDKAIAKLNQIKNGDVNEGDVAQVMDLSLDEYQYQLADLNAKLVQPELTTNGSCDPCAQAMKKEYILLAMKCINKMPIRYQQIIQLYYFNNWTFKQISKKLNCCDSRISQIHKQILKELNDFLNK